MCQYDFYHLTHFDIVASVNEINQGLKIMKCEYMAESPFQGWPAVVMEEKFCDCVIARFIGTPEGIRKATDQYSAVYPPEKFLTKALGDAMLLEGPDIFKLFVIRRGYA